EEHAIDALNRLERGELFDLILCDVHMPGLMGPDFYHWVRKVRPDYAPRIVLMTAGNLDEATELLEGVGATLLSKPIGMRTLEAIVESLGG
ncbi:MAG: response regulator, partial [Deltaproteobacteria bacterium]